LSALTSLRSLATFQASHGADHLWMVAQNSPELTLWLHARRTREFIKESHVLRNMIAGVLEVFSFRAAKPVLAGQSFTSYKFVRPQHTLGSIPVWRPAWKRPWRCSLAVPQVQSFAYSSPPSDVSDFRQWLNRKYLFFHHAGIEIQGTLSANLRRQVLKVHQVVKEPERVLVGDTFVDNEFLLQGFQNSRFCFAIAGSNGGPTRRYYDAVAHGCLPVVIIDIWLFSTAPFHDFIDHTAYAVFVPQERWLNDFTTVIEELEAMQPSMLQRRFEYMRWAAPFLLYDRAEGHAVAAMLLQQASLRCTFADREVNDSTIYPIGLPLVREAPSGWRTTKSAHT